VATKAGVIVSLGRRGSTFQEAYLDTGAKVDLPHDAWEFIQKSYPAGTLLIFVERRGNVFNFVQWAGTPEQARKALDRGLLESREVPLDLLPPESNT
jgi:hypothetical protein